MNTIFGDHAYLAEEEVVEMEMFGGDPEFDHNDGQALSRELICFVRENPILYNRSHPDFLNTNAKALTWTTIGQKLSIPMTGSDAASAFYKLRQKFGKERNKVRKTQPRSGAGTDTHVYVSAWALYNEMLFLADFMQARERTSSNYKPRLVGGSFSQVGKAMSSTLSSCGPVPISTTPVPTFSAASPLGSALRCSTPSARAATPLGSTLRCSTPSAGSSGSAMNPDLFRSLAGSSVDDSSSQTSTLDEIDFSRIEVPESPAPKPVTPQRKIPQPDGFHLKRKADAALINERFIRNSETMSQLAASVGAALEKATSDNSTSQATSLSASLPAPVQAMLSSLGWALTKVKEDDQLPCLIDLLSLVKSKYCS